MIWRMVILALFAGVAAGGVRYLQARRARVSKAAWRCVSLGGLLACLGALGTVIQVIRAFSEPTGDASKAFDIVRARIAASLDPTIYGAAMLVVLVTVAIVLSRRTPG